MKQDFTLKTNDLNNGYIYTKLMEKIEEVESRISDIVSTLETARDELTISVDDYNSIVKKMNNLTTKEEFNKHINDYDIHNPHPVYEKLRDRVEKIEANLTGATEEDVYRLIHRVETQANANYKTVNERVNNLVATDPGSTGDNTELLDIRIGYDGKTYPTAGEAVRVQVSELKSDIGEIDNAFFDTTTTEELVNTNPIVEDGKVLYTSTYIAIQEQSNSSVATLTDLVVGETLYISSTVFNTTGSYGFTFTDDKNKTIYHYYDESLSGLADKTNIEVVVPEGATKLYVSRLSSKGKPEVFRKKTVKHKAPKSNLIDVLHGKKMVVFGDSMAYGHTIPESVWTKLLAEKHSMILTNFAQNGTTITRKTTTMSGVTFLDTDSVHAKVMNNLNEPVEADYIIVFGGTNDIARNDQCPLGTIDDATSQTFYGALNAICQRLIQTYPSGNICFITPYIRNAGLANTEVCKQYIKAIHDVCEKWGGIPVFDNSVNGGVDFSHSYQIKALTMQDSYHLNEAGHLRAMHKYEVFLQSL